MYGRGAAGGTWPDEHSDCLRALMHDGKLSFAEMTESLNARLGTSYTRSSLIGRAHRMGFRHPVGIARMMTKLRKKNKPRRAPRPKPVSIIAKLAEKKIVRAKFVERGTSKTSPEYRIHLPRQPEMTKRELREMLTQAVRNTAEQAA